MTVHKPPFESIVVEYGAVVLRVCRAVVGPQEAEDAWSETFLAALTAYPALDAGANLEAWLVTIAHRKAIDAARRRSRRPSAVETVPEPPSRDGLPGERDGAIWTAVASLPDRQREAIAYHYLGGLPFKDVARVIGGSPDAARRAAHDGIKKLRAAYPAEERVDR